MNEQLIGDLFAAATRRMTGSSSKEFSEKFAELIVRQCADLCKSEWDGDADTYLASEAYNKCAEIIKQHFGVGE